MPTSFHDAFQYEREREALRILGEIETAAQDALDRHVSANGLDLIEKMQNCACQNITENQLDFLRSIRDQLVERGAL